MWGKFTLIEARLKTGRTHQIRVHMAHEKYPLRPPGGAFNLKVFNAMRRMNLRLGLWNVNTADYTGKPSQDIVRLVTENTKQ